MVPEDWVVDPHHVLDFFENNLERADEFDKKPIVIAHECCNHIYLLDEIPNRLAEIISPLELGDIMQAFDHYKLTIRWINDPYYDGQLAGHNT